jgi:mRNA interferase RelE/StbE
MYRLKFHRRVAKQLARFPKPDQKRLAEAFRALSQNPHPESCVNLREILYRIRVGRYRIVYAVFDEELVIVVVKTARRSEATYKDLKMLIDKAAKLLEKK